MEINKFINDFREQFIDSDELILTEETEYRSIGTWDSLTAMSVLVMIKDNYGIDISEKELKNANTIKEIFQIVDFKKGI